MASNVLDTNDIELATGGKSKSFRFCKNGLKEATIVWTAVQKFVSTENNGKLDKKQLLHNVSGYAIPGEVC